MNSSFFSRGGVSNIIDWVSKAFLKRHKKNFLRSIEWKLERFDILFDNHSF